MDCNFEEVRRAQNGPRPADAAHTIKVLDRGFVRLVAHMGSDLAIVRAARQSYDEGWRAGEDEGGDARLIRYLMKHRHSVPFEAAVFQFQIKAPIFVFRQLQRHRTWPFWSINEVSARYREMPEEFYVPSPEQVGEQSKSNKQGRQLTDDPALIQRRADDIGAYERTCQASFAEYHDLLAAGWPRELARCILPLATYTTLSGKVDLWNLLHFLGLRLDEHAQYEIRVCRPNGTSFMVNWAPSSAPLATAQAWGEGWLDTAAATAEVPPPPPASTLAPAAKATVSPSTPTVRAPAPARSPIEKFLTATHPGREPNDWEIKFLRDVYGRGRTPTAKQREVLDRIEQKTMADLPRLGDYNSL